MILANGILFPGTQIPLLIFEPRYRKMVEHAFKNDRRFAIYLASRQPNTEPSPVGCLGEVVAYEKLPNGSYQVLLRGERRIFCLRWYLSRPYPYLSFFPLSDIPFSSEDERAEMKARLLQSIQAYLAAMRGDPENAEKILKIAMQLSCEEIIHWSCIVLQFDLEAKQKILEEPLISKRGESILKVLEEGTHTQRVLDRVSDVLPPDPRFN